MRSASGRRRLIIGRVTTGRFVLLPFAVLDCARYPLLSLKAQCLIVEIVHRYNGSNNGRLAIPWSHMKNRGWRSKETLWNAIHELLTLGFLIKTRQGAMHQCSLYAFPWQPIDEWPDADLRCRIRAPSNWKEPMTEELRTELRKKKKPSRKEAIDLPSTNSRQPGSKIESRGAVADNQGTKDVPKQTPAGSG